MTTEYGTYSTATGRIVEYWKTTQGTVLRNPEGELTVCPIDCDSHTGATDLRSALWVISAQSWLVSNPGYRHE